MYDSSMEFDCCKSYLSWTLITRYIQDSLLVIGGSSFRNEKNTSVEITPDSLWYKNSFSLCVSVFKNQNCNYNSKLVKLIGVGFLQFIYFWALVRNYHLDFYFLLFLPIKSVITRFFSHKLFCDSFCIYPLNKDNKMKDFP